MTDISAHYAPAGDWEHPGADAYVLIATLPPSAAADDDPDAAPLTDPGTLTATVTATTIVYEPPTPGTPPPLDLQGAAAYYQLRLRAAQAGATPRSER